MSSLFTGKKICELALRKIGSYSINDTAPDEMHMREALSWLDMIVAELAGTERWLGFTPATVDLSITGGTQSYDLLTMMGASAPSEGVSFPVSAKLTDENGNRLPLEIVTREVFENVTDINEIGTPDKIYIDRLSTPTLKVHPTPATGTDTYVINLVYQKLGTNLSDHKTGLTGVDFRAAWQRYAVLRLAYDLGGGIIITLPASRIDRIRLDMTEAKELIAAFENREHESTPPIADRRDF